MAKIDNLQVTTIKIKSGAITEWFYPASGYISVTNESGNPNFVFVKNGNVNNDQIRRGSDFGVVGSVDRNNMIVVIDESPDTPFDTYLTESGYATLVAAKVRKA